MTWKGGELALVALPIVLLVLLVLVALKVLLVRHAELGPAKSDLLLG